MNPSSPGLAASIRQAMLFLLRWSGAMRRMRNSVPWLEDARRGFLVCKWTLRERTRGAGLWFLILRR